MNRRNSFDELYCRVPEMNVDGLVVSKFTVEARSLESFRLALQGGRDCMPGEYTSLHIDNRLWMSDTTAERSDHTWPVYKAWELGGRCLVNGLGLGMVVGAMLVDPAVTHVDVVENDPRVAQHVGKWFVDTYGDRVTIHEADAYEIQWPKGTRWAVAWHDIWPDLCTDNLEEMAKLHRKYGRRVRWQGSWGKELLQSYRRRGW